MNRKALIILLVVLVTVIIGGIILFYLQSFKTVRFDIKKDDVKISVYQQSNNNKTNTETQRGTLDASGEMKLQSGRYFVLAEGRGYELLTIPFEVKDEAMSITVNPDFSSERLSEMLIPELPIIQSVIATRYAGLIANFNLARGELLKQGDWYVTTLTQKTMSASEEGDVYRLVLKKEGDTWVIKTTPSLILSIKDYPDVPRDILSKVNRM